MRPCICMSSRKKCLHTSSEADFSLRPAELQHLHISPADAKQLLFVGDKPFHVGTPCLSWTRLVWQGSSLQIGRRCGDDSWSMMRMILSLMRLVSRAGKGCNADFALCCKLSQLAPLQDKAGCLVRMFQSRIVTADRQKTACTTCSP